MKTCKTLGCGKRVHARGLCDAEYRAALKDGTIRRLTVDDRWSSFVTPGAPSECWEWQGWRSPEGYGSFRLNGQQMPASRAAAIRAGLPVTDGMDVCHTCDNPPCVNPAHLYVGTRQQNLNDCTERGRHNKPNGERHWSAKYSDEQVEEWRSASAGGESFKSIARRFGAHPVTVSRTVRGIQRKVIGHA